MIVLGLLLTFSAAGLYAHYEYRAREAGVNAQELLIDVKQGIRERKQTAVVLEAPKGQMIQDSVNGLGVIGILQIEEAGIQLPVIGNWSCANLEYGPCRYSGSLEEDDLVLLGHNYQGHLADLDLVEQGDTVEFFDVTGESYTFLVAQTADIAPTDVEAVSEPEHPLTIFTCTPGGQRRFVVYCDRIDG